MSDWDESLSTSRRYTIPKKKQTERELLQEVTSTSREFQQDVLPVLQRHYWLQESSKQQFLYTKCLLVENDQLKKQFDEKRKEMRTSGYTEKDCAITEAFLHVYSEEQMREICEEGLRVNHTLQGSLGKPSMGVYLSRQSDILTSAPMAPGSIGIFIYFKILKGKIKSVTNDYRRALEPTPNFDSHVSKTLSSDLAKASPHQCFEALQIYLYEYQDTEIVEIPRTVLPYAVLYYAYMDPTAAADVRRRGPKEIFRNRERDYLLWTGTLKCGKLTVNAVTLLTNFPKLKPFSLGKFLTVKRLVPFDNCWNWKPIKDLISNREASGMLYKKREIRLMSHYVTHARLVCQMSADVAQLARKLLARKAAGLSFLRGGTTILIVPSSELSSQMGIPSLPDFSRCLHCIFVSYRSVSTGLNYARDAYDFTPTDFPMVPQSAIVRPMTLLNIFMQNFHPHLLQKQPEHDRPFGPHGERADANELSPAFGTPGDQSPCSACNATPDQTGIDGTLFDSPKTDGAGANRRPHDGLAKDIDERMSRDGPAPGTGAGQPETAPDVSPSGLEASPNQAGIAVGPGSAISGAKDGPLPIHLFKDPRLLRRLKQQTDAAKLLDGGEVVEEAPDLTAESEGVQISGGSSILPETSPPIIPIEDESPPRTVPLPAISQQPLIQGINRGTLGPPLLGGMAPEVLLSSLTSSPTIAQPNATVSLPRTIPDAPRSPGDQSPGVADGETSPSVVEILNTEQDQDYRRMQSDRIRSGAAPPLISDNRQGAQSSNVGTKRPLISPSGTITGVGDPRLRGVGSDENSFSTAVNLPAEKTSSGQPMGGGKKPRFEDEDERRPQASFRARPLLTRGDTGSDSSPTAARNKLGFNTAALDRADVDMRRPPVKLGFGANVRREPPPSEQLDLRGIQNAQMMPHFNNILDNLKAINNIAYKGGPEDTIRSPSPEEMRSNVPYSRRRGVPEQEPTISSTTPDQPGHQGSGQGSAPTGRPTESSGYLGVGREQHRTYRRPTPPPTTARYDSPSSDPRHYQDVIIDTDDVCEIPPDNQQPSCSGLQLQRAGGSGSSSRVSNNRTTTGESPQSPAGDRLECVGLEKEIEAAQQETGAGGGFANASGLLVPDDLVFIRANPEEVERILEAFLAWRERGSSLWRLKLHSQVVLQLAESKKNLQPNSTAHTRVTKLLVLLTKFRKLNIVDLLPKHECDSSSRPAVYYLPCVQRQKESHPDATFCVMLSNLNPDGDGAKKFADNDIFVMNIPTFIDVFIKQCGS